QDGGGAGWHDWFTSAGLRVERLDGPRFSNAILRIEAAIGGLGIAIARATLVSDDVLEGRLVRPLRHETPTSFSYYLVRPPVAIGPHLAAFVAWLREEADAWRVSAGHPARAH